MFIQVLRTYAGRDIELSFKEDSGIIKIFGKRSSSTEQHIGTIRALGEGEFQIIARYNPYEYVYFTLTYREVDGTREYELWKDIYAGGISGRGAQERLYGEEKLSKSGTMEDIARTMLLGVDN